jgi:hypothetical protein
MHTGLHAVGAGAQRLGIGVGLVVLVVLVAYSLLVFGVVAVQAFGAMGS